MEGIAKSTKGVCELIPDDGAMEEKVISQLKRALEPTLRKIRVDWGQFKVQIAPYQIRFLLFHSSFLFQTKIELV